jgi:hypothetical protein
MKRIVCYFKKSEELILPDIEITHKPSKKLRYARFVNSKWSERDIDNLIRGYAKVESGKITVGKMANEIGKTRSSVRNKAWRMGISLK